MKWFRLYSDVLDDPKVQLLPAETSWGWLNVLCVINETLPDRGPRSGYLPPRIEDVAYKLHKTVQDTQILLDQLVDAELMEHQKDRYRAHNWPKRQPVSDNVADRVQATRKKQKSNVTSNVTSNGKVTNKRRTSTAPEEEENRGERDQDLEQDQESETEEEEDTGTLGRVRRRLRDAHIRSPEQKALRVAILESGETCVLHCIDEAERYNKPSWAYIDSVRRRHESEGCPAPELQTRVERMTGRAAYA